MELFKNDFIENMELTFKGYLQRSDSERQKIFQDFAVFYFNDYLGIVDYLKKETLNNPFSLETLKTLKFQHINILKKVLSRLTSGIYTPQPSRYLEIENESLYDTENEKLNMLLDKVKYNIKVKESFRRAKYFNTVLVMPVYDMQTKKMRLDIYNPNDVSVKTKEDYNEIEKIAIRKADKDGHCYLSVWTETEHYIMSGTKRIAPVGNPKMKNPFSPVIPISVLRMTEGIDFYGEPNWNLFLNQKYFDIRLTDFDRSELNTIYQMWFGINTNFKESETFTPNSIKQINNVSNDDARPEIYSISANADYTGIRENIDWKIKTMMVSEGLSSNSVNSEVIEQSGISKLIDELELQESKEEDKEILSDFEKDLINKVIMVNNYYDIAKIVNANVCIEFPPVTNETIEAKKTRREMEVTYGYKNSVDFAMEDLNLTEAEAIERIKYVNGQNKILQVRETEQSKDTNDNKDTEQNKETNEYEEK